MRIRTLSLVLCLHLLIVSSQADTIKLSSLSAADKNYLQRGNNYATANCIAYMIKSIPVEKHKYYYINFDDLNEPGVSIFAEEADENYNCKDGILSTTEAGENSLIKDFNSAPLKKRITNATDIGSDYNLVDLDMVAYGLAGFTASEKICALDFSAARLNDHITKISGDNKAVFVPLLKRYELELITQISGLGESDRIFQCALTEAYASKHNFLIDGN